MMQNFQTLRLKNVIQYLEHYEIGERYIIIMEFLGDEWVDLYDYIELMGPVEEDLARTIFKTICETIQKLHALGFTHNDIKGMNFMDNLLMIR